MNSLFKKIILVWIVFFTSFLFADQTKAQVFSNGSVTESASSADFTIKITDGVDACDELKVDYTTVDGSATEPDDYTKKDSSATFYGWCAWPVHLFPSRSKTVSVNVVDDSDYEGNQGFSLKLTSVTSGYQIDSQHKEAFTTIIENDVEPLKLISFNDKSITEGDVDTTLYMVAAFNKNTTQAMTLTYHTENATALAGSDYLKVASSEGNNVIHIPANRSSVNIPIVIKGDLVPEVTKNFKVVIDSISVGTINAGEDVATATVYDDDAIVFNISSTNVFEGNPGDHNKMDFVISLHKALPPGTPDITIDYETADGTLDTSTIDPATLLDVDYSNTTGHVVFTDGGATSYTISVPIVGDDNVELDESLKMNIFRAGVNIGSSESLILPDESYPGIDFSRELTPMDHMVIEGNSSVRMLNFNFTLDADAIAGTSFKYTTQDSTAKIGDNDYVETNATYNVPIGTRDINISIPVNGDSNIEHDELFYLLISDETNLNVVGHIAKGHIINDDGSYPKLNFDLSTYDIDEGNSGISDINFTLSLNKPAVAGASFNYHTEDVNTASSDYTAIPTIPIQTYTFVGGETNITIPIQVKGDTFVEPNERFKLVLSDFDKLDNLPTDTLYAYGKIINDDAPHVITNIGEFRFDDCGAGEWKKDYSSVGNNALSTSNILDPAIITDDDKSYMCGSLNGYNATVKVPHNLAYEVNEGTFSILLYDHHSVGGWVIEKGDLKVKIARVGGDASQGTITVDLNGHTIDTQEVFFTNSGHYANDHDTQWIHIAVTFGAQGLKLYINGVEKGSNSYTGGIASNTNDITLSTASGYFDEFYMFKGQMNAGEAQQLYNNVINNINIDGTPRDCGCYVATDPFTCNSTMYISSSTNRETSATGRMWLHRVDTTQNPFDFKVVEPVGNADLYNATAYNPDDNYIYGLFHRELIKITRAGIISNLGTITGLPNRFDENQLYAGAISNGYYYVAGRNTPKKKIYKIDINSTSLNYKNVTTITLSKKVALQDFSFYKNVNDATIPDGVFLHGVDRDDKFTKIDVRDGTVTQVGSKHIGYEFDSSFSDMNGRFFANDSLGHGFFEFDVATGSKSFISNSQPATFNDGANCINAPLVFNDYGDAPSSYGIPKHNIANGIFMGDEVDHDAFAYSSVNALGDDSSGMDDEDGVTLSDGSDINGVYFEPGVVQNFTIKVSKTGYLNAWIDYNADGDFLDAGEKIFSAKMLTAGTHPLSVTIPNTITVNKTSYIRFRYSSTSNLTAIEDASDGEIEDYTINLGSDSFTGKFNVERTNSGDFHPIMTDERNAWYTQTVGRDFNYSVVFYEEDFSAEKNISNVTLKIDLIDMDTNVSLYQKSFHVLESHIGSRMDILDANDLKNLPATKNARFRITYGVDCAGNVIQADCLTHPGLCTYNRPPDEAKDNFAIRPLDFDVSIADSSTTLHNYPLRVAAGYDYNLSVVATPYPSTNHNASAGYDASFVGKLEFVTTGTCADESNGTVNTHFIDGKFNDINFTNAEVGDYILKLKDSTWTQVDASRNQCDVNSSSISNDPNFPSGCNIEAISDINLSFYPYQFDVNFVMANLPSSGHDDFIYMTDVDLLNHDVAIQFVGDITAKNEDNTTTHNFTDGCVAEPVRLNPNALTVTDNGTGLIRTTNDVTKNPTFRDIDILRMTQFNEENLTGNNFTPIHAVTDSIVIAKDKFLDESSVTDKGATHLDLRYNINKPLSRTINPVQITFNRLAAESASAYSMAEHQVQYIPSGIQDFNQTRNFYFARVSPDKENYPKVVFTQNPTIRTPLNVDVFCDLSIAYCNDTGIRDNTDLSGLSRVQDGWYISTNHNTAVDGTVQNLNHASPNLTIAPDNNISFTIGRNGIITDTFNACNSANDTVLVQIVPDDVLKYSNNPLDNGNPSYTVSCTDQNSSELSGIGQTGNIINNKANTQKASKIDW